MRTDGAGPDAAGWSLFFEAPGEVVGWLEGRAGTFCWNGRDREETLEIVAETSLYFYVQFDNECSAAAPRLPGLKTLSRQEVRFGFSRWPGPLDPSPAYSEGRPTLIGGEVVQVYVRARP